ncbi:MAG: ImmA/IrrE family metallo-endopeptidase [Lautropia sp.]|nr:ImmA/IrrE family metallo-endopeptidase [Lautropia sp.]
MTHVAASVPVLRWAARRARKTDEALCQRFTKWPQWLSGEAQPTLRQLEDFAQFTHTGIGYFFLPEPPSEPLPLPDFRTLRDHELAEPSSELLDTIHLCQRRQDWYREHARLNGWPPLPFVGSLSVQTTPVEAAQKIRQTIQLSTEARRHLSTWEAALRQLIALIEDSGVLVMASAVVGSNSHRKLDVGEFRGFTLADDLAPVIFLNTADSKAAQMFTLGHELAHVWLGQSGVSDPEAGQMPRHQTERWCNLVAAELLVPMAELKTAYQPGTPIPDEMQRLARSFKVSTLVILRRLFDAGHLDESGLWHHYRQEQDRLQEIMQQRKGSGGDFYRSLAVRASKRFSRALISSTLEGGTLFRDAFQMLGIRSSRTFHKTARELSVAP